MNRRGFIAALCCLPFGIAAGVRHRSRNRLANRQGRRVATVETGSKWTLHIGGILTKDEADLMRQTIRSFEV